MSWISSSEPFWRRKLSPESCSLTPLLFCGMHVVTHTIFLIWTMITFQCWLSQHFYLYFSNYALCTWVLNLLDQCNTFSGKASFLLCNPEAELPAHKTTRLPPSCPSALQHPHWQHWTPAASCAWQRAGQGACWLAPGCQSVWHVHQASWAFTMVVAPLWQLLEEASPSAVGRKLAIPTGDVALE